MHIEPIRFLENGTSNVEFIINGRFRLKFLSLNWDDNAKIKKAIAIDKNNKNKEKKDLQKRSK